jgi:hypothetical protein
MPVGKLKPAREAAVIRDAMINERLTSLETGRVIGSECGFIVSFSLSVHRGQ